MRTVEGDMCGVGGGGVEVTVAKGLLLWCEGGDVVGCGGVCGWMCSAA